MALAQIASASFHPSHSVALWSCTAGAWASMPGSSGHSSIHYASLYYCHMAGCWVAVVWSSEWESEPRPRVINGFHYWRPGPQGSTWHRTPHHKSPSITCQQRGKGVSMETRESGWDEVSVIHGRHTMLAGSSSLSPVLRTATGPNAG